MNKKMTGLAMAAVAALAAEAKVEFGTPFSDGMVLQRDRDVPVWGTADAGEEVRVTFGDQSLMAKADKDGKWFVKLAPMAASKEGRTLMAEGMKNMGWWDARFAESDDAARAEDVLVGEVWMCSGQSNTDCPIWGHGPRYRDGQGAMHIAMTKRPFVRIVKTKLAWDVKPKTDYKAKWMKMEPEMMKEPRLPSAMGWYYALELANALDIPVGLVDSSVGGTNIDSWTPKSGIASRPDLKDVLDWPMADKEHWKPSMAEGPVGSGIQQPTALWNGMVAAYAPMAIRGFIWYQGCHNAGEYKRYASKMHALYNGWAKEFDNPDLKLYFVQLTPWGNPVIPHIQEAQAQFAAEEKNTAMAVINDVGNLTDIHPNDKRTVAKRLALHALKRDYGFNWLNDNSPTLKSWKIDGDKFVLSFNDVDEWYLYNPTQGDKSVGFEIAGADGVFKKAELVNVLTPVNGRTKKPEFRGNIKGKDLIVRAEGVKEPKKLRYLYSAPWFGGLYNTMNLPLGVFHIGD